MNDNKHVSDAQLLVDNLSKKKLLPTWMLVCFQLYTVWQMGVIFFSSTTLSLYGRTPLPITVDNVAVFIALGYISSWILLIFLQKETVWIMRVTVIFSMAGTILFLMPFPSSVLTGLFFAEAFLCTFMIGCNYCVVVNIFTMRTELRDLLICLLVACPLIALLNNEFFQISFENFQIFSVFIHIGLLIFYFGINSNISIRYAKKTDKIKAPTIMIWGVYTVTAIVSLLICFASSIAESVKHGVFTMYLAAGAGGIIVWLLWKRLKVPPFKIGTIFIGFSTVAFVVAFMSLSFPSLSLVACALLGASIVAANMVGFFLLGLFHIYPSRFIGPSVAILGMSMALLHAMLLEAFRSNLGLLYAIFTVIAVFLSVFYIMTEPYLSFAWRQTEQAKPKKPKLMETALQVSQSKISSTPAFFELLTEQERNLASLILQGYTESSIAQNMNISINTQKSYRKNLYNKLDIHSKRELFHLSEKEI